MRDRKRVQWTLRSLFLMTTLCAIVLGFVERSRREQMAIAWLAKRGAEVTLESSGPAWLRELIGEKWFSHATAVGGFQYSTDGVRLTAEEVAMFGRLPKLYSVDVGGMEVTDDVLPALGQLSPLKQLSLGGRCQCSMAAIEDLADAHPDWDIDVALAESLYRHVRAEAEMGTAKAPEAMFLLRTAASWKLACAKFKHGHESEVAARRQYLHSLERLRQQLEANAESGLSFAKPMDIAFAKCAVAQAHMELVAALGQAFDVTLADQAVACANDLLALLDEGVQSGTLHPIDAVSGWQLATDVLVMTSRSEGKADAVPSAQGRHVTACRKLVERIGSLRDSQGHESLLLRLSKVALARAGAELARRQNAVVAEQQVLRDGQTDARELRLAAQAFRQIGTITSFQLAFAWCQADELELALAESLGDDSLRKSVKLARIEGLSRCVLGECGILEQGHLRTGDLLLTVLVATACLDTRGGDPLEQSITQFGPGLNISGAPRVIHPAADEEPFMDLDGPLAFDEVDGEEISADDR